MLEKDTGTSRYKLTLSEWIYKEEETYLVGVGVGRTAHVANFNGSKENEENEENGDCSLDCLKVKFNGLCKFNGSKENVEIDDCLNVKFNGFNGNGMKRWYR